VNLTWIARQFALSVTLAIVTGIAPAAAAAADAAGPFIGKWLRNIQKSTFGTDQPLKSNVFTIADPGDGKWQSAVDYVEGDTSTHAEYTTAAACTSYPRMARHCADRWGQLPPPIVARRVQSAQNRVPMK
jgi:hypothetical protein